MKKIILIIAILSFLIACKNKGIKHSGFDDLFIGSETINLFDNGEFNIEIGLGFQKGNYQISNDTIYLFYKNENRNMPNKFLLKADKFESIEFNRKIDIRRNQ